MYRGKQAQIRAGFGGYNGNSNSYQIPVGQEITQLTVARNIRFTGNAWRKAGGLAKYDANGISGNPQILGATAWRPNSATQDIVTACDDGKVYLESSGNLDATTLVSSLSLANPIVFVAGGALSVSDDRELFMFHEGVAPQVLAGTGTSMSAVSSPATDWTSTTQPTGGVNHDGRMVAWLRHNLYFSALTDHQEFNDGANTPVFDVAPGVGNEIRACFSLINNRLYVFKDVGIFYVDTTDIATATFLNTKTLRTDVGCAGPNAVTRVKDDVWFISTQGHLISVAASDTSEDLASADISAILKLNDWVTENVDLDRIKYARLVYDDRRQELHAYFTSKTGTYNDIGLIIDVSLQGNPRITIEDRGEYFEAAFPYLDSSKNLQIYVGGENGYIYKTDETTRAIDTNTGYTSSFEIPPTDFAWINPDLGGMTKRFDWVEIVTQTTGEYDLTMDVIIDDITVASKSLTLGVTGGTLPFTLDTDTLGADSIATRVKVPIEGCGQRIALRFTNSIAQEDFSVSNITIFYQPLGTPGST